MSKSVEALQKAIERARIMQESIKQAVKQKAEEMSQTQEKLKAQEQIEASIRKST